MLLEDPTKLLLYNLLLLLISKDIKEFIVYNTNNHRYIRSIEDKKTKDFTILIAKLD